jgi:hypothetical protein
VSSSRKKSTHHHQTCNIEKDILQHRTETVVTATVADIAKGFFIQRQLLAGIDVDKGEQDRYANVCNPEAPVKVHAHNPTKIVWGEPVQGHKGFYKSVFIDGTEYSVSGRNISAFK